MSVYSFVTEQDLINLRKLAKPQKKQRATETENGILKQTDDINLVESSSPIPEKLDEVNDSTKKLEETVHISDVEDRNTQTPTIENVTGTQSLRDT